MQKELHDNHTTSTSSLTSLQEKAGALSDCDVLEQCGGMSGSHLGFTLSLVLVYSGKHLFLCPPRCKFYVQCLVGWLLWASSPQT